MKEEIESIEKRLSAIESIVKVETYDGIKGAKWEKAKHKIEFKRIPDENDDRDEGVGSVYVDHLGRVACNLGNDYRITLYADYIDIYEDAIEMMQKIVKLKNN
jgi:hypothetical protein